MKLRIPDSSLLLPFGLLALLHGAAMVLGTETLAAQKGIVSATYIPWLVALGFAAGSVLAFARPGTFPASLILMVWAMAIQLMLIPPGFPNTFRLLVMACLLYTSPSPRDRQKSRMPSSA